MSRKTAVLHFSIKEISRTNKAKRLSVYFPNSQGMYTEGIFKSHKAYLIITPNKTAKYVAILCSIMIKCFS